MKRGQLESGELVMVVIIVLILVISILVGYSKIKGTMVQDTVREIESLEVIELVQEVIATPEIKCAHSDDVREGCIDIMRLNATHEISANAKELLKKYYRIKFGTSRIVIKEIYPESERKWVLADFEPPVVKAEVPFNFPVYLYNATTKKNSFGVIMVTKYE